MTSLLDLSVRKTIQTLGPMAIPVDYDDGGGGAVADPPPGFVFRNQAEVDAFLASGPYTAIKHLTAAIEALPRIIAHNVVINLTGGVHRPQAGRTDDTAWPIVGRMMTEFDFNASGASITIQGDSNTSNWVVVVGATTITAHSVLFSGAPFLDVSGTPYTAGALKGYFAFIAATGMLAPIIDNTTSRLWLGKGFLFDGEPTDSVDTVQVLRPNTIMRNSLDDATALYGTMFDVLLQNQSQYVHINDIELEFWSPGFAQGLIVESAAVNLSNTIINAESVASGVNGRAISVRFGGSLDGDHLTILGDKSGFDDCIATGSGGVTGYFISLKFFWCRSADASDGIFLDGDGHTRMFSCVMDPATVKVLNGARLDSSDFSNLFGPFNLLRGIKSGRAALQYGRLGTFYRISAPPSQLFQFEGCTGPCVRIGPYTIMPAIDALGNVVDQSFQNKPGGAPNTDVGIEVIASHSTMLLASDTDVSGTAGDLRIEGVVGSYDDIGTRDNPLQTSNFNVIGRD